jgi:hypothetical protein
MDEDKPDRFGKYRDRILNIHNPLWVKICNEFSFDISLVEIPIHQMSIYEYISAKHDEDYTYFLYEINEGHSASRNPDFFISVNNKYLNDLFNKNFFEVKIAKLISEIWNYKDVKKMNNYFVTKKLKIVKDDVIQSVHLFYKGEQLFKIIYFYDSFGKILEE